jgi:hypothetical protein
MYEIKENDIGEKFGIGKLMNAKNMIAETSRECPIWENEA